MKTDNYLWGPVSTLTVWKVIGRDKTLYPSTRVDRGPRQFHCRRDRNDNHTVKVVGSRWFPCHSSSTETVDLTVKVLVNRGRKDSSKYNNLLFFGSNRYLSTRPKRLMNSRPGTLKSKTKETYLSIQTPPQLLTHHLWKKPYFLSMIFFHVKIGERILRTLSSLEW